jgi:predicted amino acid dehydrogenase
VVGANGSIGRTSAEILKDYFGSIVLVVRDEEQGRKTAQAIGLKDQTYSVVTHPAFIRQAHVVITVTSAESEVVMPEDLAPGTVVIDFARPRDVSVRVAKERPDVLVIEGGVVAVPGAPKLGLDFGFGPGNAYACMCETMILAAEGLLNQGEYRAFTVGKTVTTDMALEMGRLAFVHDFKLAGYRSFEREVFQEDLDRFRLIAEKRIPWIRVPATPAD